MCTPDSLNIHLSVSALRRAPDRRETVRVREERHLREDRCLFPVLNDHEQH